ncbi:uncharacterized protein K452DRAFT_293394, partial [Aplosporella prunicola CBS 121167]
MSSSSSASPARPAAERAPAVNIVEALPPRPFNPNRAVTTFSKASRVTFNAYVKAAPNRIHFS